MGIGIGLQIFLVPPWLMWMITQTGLAAFSRASEVANIPSLYNPNLVECLAQCLFGSVTLQRTSLILITHNLRLRRRVIRNPTLGLILLVRNMVVLHYQPTTTQMTWIFSSHNSNPNNSGVVRFLGIDLLSHVESVIAVKPGIIVAPVRFVGVRNSSKVAAGNSACSKGRCVWQMILNFSSPGGDKYLEVDMLHHAVSARIAKQKEIVELVRYAEVQSLSKVGVVSIAYTGRKYVLAMVFRGNRQKSSLTKGKVTFVPFHCPSIATYLTSTMRPSLTTLLHPRVSRQERARMQRLLEVKCVGVIICPVAVWVVPQAALSMSPSFPDVVPTRT